MKDSKKSDQRVLSAMKLGYQLCKDGDEISWNDIAKAHKISNSFATFLTRLGVIVKLGNRRFDWIGDEPSEDMVKKIKSNHFQRPLLKQEVIDFEQRPIDEKLNQIEFMCNQIFERVEYLFENLATKDAKDKIHSDWFHKIDK